MFYAAVPLEESQGCIAGPKHNWVGVYWLSVTIFYTASVWYMHQELSHHHLMGLFDSLL
jgi:hypothetical protein